MTIVTVSDILSISEDTVTLIFSLSFKAVVGNFFLSTVTLVKLIVLGSTVHVTEPIKFWRVQSNVISSVSLGVSSELNTITFLSAVKVNIFESAPFIATE